MQRCCMQLLCMNAARSGKTWCRFRDLDSEMSRSRIDLFRPIFLINEGLHLSILNRRYIRILLKGHFLEVGRSNAALHSMRPI